MTEAIAKNLSVATFSTSRVLPVSKPRSRFVGPTTERDNKSGDDQHNDQDDWRNPWTVSKVLQDINANTLLFTKEKKNSDSPKYRTPNKLKEIMTTRIAAM